MYWRNWAFKFYNFLYFGSHFRILANVIAPKIKTIYCFYDSGFRSISMGYLGYGVIRMPLDLSTTRGSSGRRTDKHHCVYRRPHSTLRFPRTASRKSGSVIWTAAHAQPESQFEEMRIWKQRCDVSWVSPDRGRNQTRYRQIKSSKRNFTT